MNPVKIAKTFHWEMAHRLPYHTGGCQNLHGHGYRMEVELTGSTMENGMVLDYGDLKGVVEPLVRELDHGFMCSSEDKIMIDFLKQTDFKVIHVPFYTTAENIAAYFMEQIRTRFSNTSNLARLTIRVYETRSTYAEVACELNPL